MHKAKFQALGDNSEKETNPCSHEAYILMGKKDKRYKGKMKNVLGCVGVEKNEGK